MRTIVLAIFAAILAVGISTATQAQDSPTLGVMEQLQELQQTYFAAVTDSITVRKLDVEDGYASGSHHGFDAETDTIGFDPLTGALVVSMEYRASQSSGFRVYVDHKRLLDVAPPVDDGFNDRHQWFIVNRINVVFSQEPVAYITRECQDNWYWGIGWEMRGNTCPPPGDPRGWQSVPPDVFGLELYGCSIVEKQCAIDPVTNEEHCPLVCVEPGWSPDIIPENPNLYR